MDEHEINHIVSMYKKKRERESHNYHTNYKYNESMQQANRDRAKEYYINNNNKKKEAYIQDKDFYKAKSSYYYYVKNKKLDVFHSKFSDRVKLLQDRGFKVQLAVEPPFQLAVEL